MNPFTNRQKLPEFRPPDMIGKTYYQFELADQFPRLLNPKFDDKITKSELKLVIKLILCNLNDLLNWDWCYEDNTEILKQMVTDCSRNVYAMLGGQEYKTMQELDSIDFSYGVDTVTVESLTKSDQE